MNARRASRTRRMPLAGLIAAVSLAVVTGGAAGAAPAIAAEEPHLLTWGDNTWGVMGTGAALDSDDNPVMLVQRPGDSEFVAVAQSPDHGLGVDAQGRVWAWGDNTYGGLGRDPHELPITTDIVPVEGLPAGDYVQVAVGEEWSAALAADGTVYAWGWGASGQLGDGTTRGEQEPNPVAVRVDLPLPATELQAGALFGAARLDDGSIWLWGDNAYGQLGVGAGGPTVQNSPVELPLPPGVTFSSFALASISMTALDDTGRLWGWGSNIDGNLAIGSDGGSGVTPEIVSEPTLSHMPAGVGYESAAAGDYNGMALGDDGTLYIWGEAASGVELHPRPADLPAGTGPYASFGCQILRCFVLGQDGRVTTWAPTATDAPVVVDYTVGHPASSLYVGQSNAFVVAAAEAPRITTDALHGGEVGKAYTADVAFTGLPIVATRVTSGALPDGLSLSASGRVEGTPTRAGDFRVTVAAASAAGESSREYTVHIGDPAAGGSRDDRRALAATGADPAPAALAGVLLLALGVVATTGAAVRRTRRRA